jgi:DNA uptake protein ComE-like DNA-binding protein
LTSGVSTKRHSANRRQFLGGLTLAGAGLVATRTLTFAQDASPAATATAPVAGEALWTRFNLNSATNDQFSTIPGVGDRMLDEFNEYKPYASILEYRQEIGKYVDESQVADWEKYLFVPVDPASADRDTLQQLPGVSSDIAGALASGDPYADEAAFLDALASKISPEQTALAPQYMASTAGTSASWIRFDLNKAANEQFSTIPGVGDRMLKEFAEYKPYSSILVYRQEIGKYVDEAQVAAWEKYLFVTVDPNNADADTLAQLPGISEEEANALIAARPYADNATFETALADYVSPDQAALIGAYLT